LVIKILPAGEYITHTYLNDPSTLRFSLQYLYHTFLPKSGLFPLNPWEIEHCKDQGEVFIPVQTKDMENQSSKFKTGEPH
jgi:hypothetical protein